jgi:hypothetical protein
MEISLYAWHDSTCPKVHAADVDLNICSPVSVIINERDVLDMAASEAH